MGSCLAVITQGHRGVKMPIKAWRLVPSPSSCSEEEQRSGRSYGLDCGFISPQRRQVVLATLWYSWLKMVILPVPPIPSALLNLCCLGNHSDTAVTMCLEIAKAYITRHISGDVRLCSRCEKLCCRHISAYNWFSKYLLRQCERLSTQVCQEVSFSAVTWALEWT